MYTAGRRGWEEYVKIEAELEERLADPPMRSTRQAGGRSRIKRRRWGALLFVLGLAASMSFLLALTGCGYGDDVQEAGPVTSAETTEGSGETQTTPSTEAPGQNTTTTAGDPSKPENLTLSVYFPAAGEHIATAHRTVPYTIETADAAMGELLEGPTDFERETAKMATAIPEGTTLLGINMSNGTATVDLSKEFASGGGTTSMTLRLAQVVFTLTQFPSIENVQFMLDGEAVTVFGGEGILLEEPVGRDYFEDVAPPILVESPAVGDVVSSPLRVSGSANVFEATFQMTLADGDGLILVERTVTATSGTGTRGTFDVTLEYENAKPGLGGLIVYTYSAKDGSQENLQEIPVRFEPPAS